MPSFFATAPKGVEEPLAAELTALGAAGVKVRRSGVEFSGTIETAMRACLWSRTASRVLMPLATFPAADPDQLYEGVKAIPWRDHLSPSSTFAVEATLTRSAITHSHYAALRVKDAVVDQFREATGERPSVDTEAPDLTLNLHLEGEEGTLSLDLSGKALHRRGYREATGAAPLKENLAAVILLRAGWPAIAAAGGPLVDPLCGSGTFLLEGALMAGDIAPGIFRARFGFMGWRGFDRALWKGLTAEATERRRAGAGKIPPILGFDSDRRAVTLAREAAARAGLGEKLAVEARELEKLVPPHLDPPGLVVANPPYGERMGDTETLAPLYAALGARLREGFTGWEAAVFTGSPELGKTMGLRSRKHYSLYNGALPCKLLLFTVAPGAFVSEKARWKPEEVRIEEEPAETEPAAPFLTPGVFVEEETPPPAPLGPGGQMFANRLRKNLKNIGRWAEREGIGCFRLYDADLPEYAVAVDIYERWAHVSEYEAPPSVDKAKAEERLAEALAAVSLVTRIPPERVFSKVRFRRKGGTQYEKLGAMGAFHRVHEGGLSFLVNFRDYLDTGLFLDHRPTRKLIREMAGGKRFLNLFAYTGAATVYAAAGGAASTLTIDMSNTYNEWARKNFELNGIAPARHVILRADCTEWIKDEKGRYDLIFLDPPSFSHSKGMEGTFDVQRDHAWLLRATARLLAPGGTLVFSNNLRTFAMDRDGLGTNLKALDITAKTIPRDFARSPRIHNCWLVTR